jgi:hypothetical protein
MGRVRNERKSESECVGMGGNGLSATMRLLYVLEGNPSLGLGGKLQNLARFACKKKMPVKGV